MTKSIAYSADELKELAQALNDMASALPVGAPGPDGLEAMRWSQSLGGAAQNLTLMAVQSYLAETTEPLAGIIVATQDATKAVKRINAINKVVELVGDVLLLATVIWLQKWNLVLPTAKELRNDLRAS